MLYLLISIPVLCSFFGIYYYILTGNKSDKEVRFIPFIFMFIIVEAIPFMVVPSYISGSFIKVVINYLSFLWVLTFLLLFLYEQIEKKKISNVSISIILIPTIMLTSLFIILLILNRSGNSLGNVWLFYGYFSGMLLITIYFVALFFKRSYLKKMRYPHHNLIHILTILIEIAWMFLIVWFIVNYNSGNLFAEPLYVFFNLMELAVALTLYLYLFELYKNKLRQEKLVRLKDFASVPEIPVMVASTSRSNEKQYNEIQPNQEMSYKKSALNSKKLESYKKIIEDYFISNKSAYLDPNFNMEFLSSQTGISRYHLSQVFNLGLQISFPGYVNEKRIKYACELIKENNGNLTVSELMDRCGIRSRASFYFYFKKVAGCMPGEYLFS